MVNGRLGTVEDTTSTPPEWAVPLLAPMSGYVQSAHPELLLPLASQHGVHVRLRVWVGEHIVSGTVLAWMWTAAPDQPAPDPAIFQRALDRAVQVGFERTEQQDAALGIRQLVDMACKALSPAVNDPYTAVQAIDHLSVIFCALAVRPLGDDVAADPTGRGVVIVPGRRFGDYLATMCGLIRRYGCAEPTVSLALLGLLHECASRTGRRSGPMGRDRRAGRPHSGGRHPRDRAIGRPHARRRRRGRSAAAGGTASSRAAREIADRTLSYFYLRKCCREPESVQLGVLAVLAAAANPLWCGAGTPVSGLVRATWPALRRTAAPTGLSRRWTPASRDFGFLRLPEAVNPRAGRRRQRHDRASSVRCCWFPRGCAGLLAAWRRGTSRPPW